MADDAIEVRMPPANPGQFLAHTFVLRHLVDIVAEIKGGDAAAFRAELARLLEADASNPETFASRMQNFRNTVRLVLERKT